jgi:hypothetical protein
VSSIHFTCGAPPSPEDDRREQRGTKGRAPAAPAVAVRLPVMTSPIRGTPARAPRRPAGRNSEIGYGRGVGGRR